MRQALGLGKVFFYGDSYGTLFGQAYAVRYPGSLRGLILDSAYPADDPYYRTLYPAGLAGLRTSCRLAPACSGDPVVRLSRVVRRFHAAERSTDGLISFLLEAGTLAPRSYLNLDDGDRRFLDGDPRRLNRLIAPARPASANSANSPTGWRSRSSATTTRCCGTRRWGRTNASASSTHLSPACRATTSRPSAGASTCSPRRRT